MPLSITDYDGYNLAELKQISFHGLPGIGCFTLVASLDFHVAALRRESTLEQLQLRIEWGDNTQSLLGFGHLDQAQPILIPKTGSFTTSFRLCLSFGQIEALEQRRRGGGTYNAGGASADLYQWWELQLVRETFNQMLALTQDLAVFERMAEWLRETNRPGLADNATIALGFVRTAIESETPTYNSPSGRSMFDIATCVNFGCDDLNACTDSETLQPCSWLRVDRLAGQGVCSACPDAVNAWDEKAGAKTAHAGT